MLASGDAAMPAPHPPFNHLAPRAMHIITKLRSFDMSFYLSVFVGVFPSGRDASFRACCTAAGEGCIMGMVQDIDCMVDCEQGAW